MAIFISQKNVESDIGFGKVINKIKKEFIEPELKRRQISDFTTVGVEILKDGNHKVYMDNEVEVVIEFKNRKINPSDTGKNLKINLQEIKDMKWYDQTMDKESAKILVVRFSKDWWIWSADYKKRREIEDKFKIITTVKIRGGGYLPLKLLKQEKGEFVQGWRKGLKKELPSMWKRHITVSQRYRGAMVYDGNYFDLFSHTETLFVLGYYYSSIIICRTAAEQALVCIILKTGNGSQIYKNAKSKHLESIEGLVSKCRSFSLFRHKYPINKTAARKLNEISNLASNLSHPKQDLEELEKYKLTALKCMDNLYYVIKKHLNFVKDTGIVSGYRIGKESARRLR